MIEWITKGTAPERICIYSPNWFARVFLGQEPEYALMSDLMKQASAQISQAFDKEEG